jgi:hypothetical protein
MRTVIRINNEKLKVAIDMLSAAVEHEGMHYVEDVRVECLRTIVIKGLENSIEIPIEYVPVLALRLLKTYESVKDTYEIMAKRFREGVWD